MAPLAGRGRAPVLSWTDPAPGWKPHAAGFWPRRASGFVLAM